MDKFITVKKDSPDFQKYIENRVSNFRAVPVESQNINTELEMVTFELKEMSEFASITLKQKIVPLLKLNKFLYFFSSCIGKTFIRANLYETAFFQHFLRTKIVECNPSENCVIFSIHKNFMLMAR